MDKILVSACLLGDKCTYKGGSNTQDYLSELNQFYDLVPFCCEVEGGLSIPRLPSEIKGNSVKNSEGKDVTSAFRLGVYKASSIVSYLGIRLAILKENSPSCGSHFVYDGTFSGRLVKGQGLLARELTRLGVTVMNEEEGKAFLEKLKAEKAIKDEKTKLAIDREAGLIPEEKPTEERRPFKKPFVKKGEGERKAPGHKFGKKPFEKREGGEKKFGKKPFGKPGLGKKDGKRGPKKFDRPFHKAKKG